MALPLLFHPSIYSVQQQQQQQKNPLHEYFSKTASPWCFWFRLTVTECRSRWIIPSIQTAAIVILKRADICWRAERGSFQRNDESPVFGLFRKRAPMSGWGHGRKGGKEKESAFKQQSPLFFLHLVLPFVGSLYFCFLFCTSLPAVWTVVILMRVSTKAFFGNTFKETCISLSPQYLLQ